MPPEVTLRQILRFAAVLVFIAGIQTEGAAQGTPLVVDGDVARPLSLTPADLKSLPRARIEVKAEKGITNIYQGVLASELLKSAGMALGAHTKGGAVAAYVVATAADGYQAVFSIAELDPAFMASEVMVADTVDGKPLADRQGPLRLVAPKDLHGSRSVRMLQRLQVVRLRK
jgi:DMSO/TMAO reductase YedYZ molybdopterin-dependent catalytic subunit